MRNIPYVTDNPYRLLGVGSALSQKKLREAAAARKNAETANPAESGLWRVVGTEDLSRCETIIRSLAKNHRKRTAFRLLWPFEYAAPANADGTITDLNKLVFSRTDTAGFQTFQLRFLTSWIEFAVHGTPESFEETYAGLNALCSREECDRQLTMLLCEDGLDSAEAADVVYKARQDVVDQLLKTGCERVVGLWEAGDTRRSLALLKTVCESALPSESIIKALREMIVPIGEQEQARLLTIVEKLSSSQFKEDLCDIAGAQRLAELARTVGSRVERSVRWLKSVELYAEQLADAMRVYAISLYNEKKDTEGAKRTLQQALELPLSTERKQEIRMHLNRISGTVYEQGTESTPEPRRVGVIAGIGIAVVGLVAAVCLFFSIAFQSKLPGITDRTPSSASRSVDGSAGKADRVKPATSVSGTGGVGALSPGTPEEERRARLEAEYNELRPRLEQTELELAQKRGPLTQQVAELTRQASQLQSDLAFYTESRDAEAVRVTKLKLKANRAELARCKKEADKFNRDVKRYQQDLRRLRQIMKALDIE